MDIIVMVLSVSHVTLCEHYALDLVQIHAHNATHQLIDLIPHAVRIAAQAT